MKADNIILDRVYHLILDGAEGLYLKDLEFVERELKAFTEGAEETMKPYGTYDVAGCIEDIEYMKNWEIIEFGDYKISCILMTKERFNNLPIFMGY